MKVEGWLRAAIVFSASALFAQAAPPGPVQSVAPARDSPKPPAFSAAGAHGTTSPSGYATGISREETSAAYEGVSSLTRELLGGYVSDWPEQGCRMESGLVAAADANPQAFAPNRALGLFYLEHGEFLRGIPYLEVAHRLRPDRQDNLHALALAQLGGRKYQEATELLQSALANAGQRTALLRLLALAQQTAGDEQKARETFQQAVAAAPDDTQNLLAAGFGLLSAGAPHAAIELFRSATSRFPQNAQLWLGLGVGQEVVQQRSDAVGSLLHAIEVDRELLPAYSFVAALADASAEQAPAIRARLAEFVVAHSASAEAHYDYALALWLQRRMDLAGASAGEMEAQLKLALAADPAMAKALYLSGLLAIDAGDLPRAEKQFSEAVRLDPGNAEAHYHLAQTYQRAHNTQLAAEETRQFQSLRRSGNPAEAFTETNAEVGPQGATANLITQLASASPCHGPS